jgi:hypothetical protein
MAPVILHPNGPRATAAAISRWMRLIELHGGPAEALDALLRDADKLDRLQCAIRACGLDPEQLLQDSAPARLRAER